MADYDKVELTALDKEQIRRNKNGRYILLAGIVLILIGCIAGAGWLAPIALIPFLAGLFITLTNKTEHQIREEKALAQTKAELMIAQAKAGQKIDIDNTPSAKAAKQKEETKKIIKGAVVGKIVAGDAGAVIGAVTAKNKIDNEKK